MFSITNTIKGLRTIKASKWLLVTGAAAGLGLPAMAQAARTGRPGQTSRVQHSAPAPQADRHDQPRPAAQPKRYDQPRPMAQPQRHDDPRPAAYPIDRDHSRVIVHDGPIAERRAEPDHRDGFLAGFRFGGRTWVAPVYQTVTQQVWVPDQFADQPVTFYDANGQLCTRIDHVLIAPGHYETQSQQVLISAGHWESAGPIFNFRF